MNPNRFNYQFNYQVRSYMFYEGQKTDKDYYYILFDKIPKEILFKHGYYNLRLLYNSFKNYPNCNILTFEEVDFCNVVEFEFMLNLVNDTKQIDTLRFKAINLHNYINEIVKFIKSNHTIKSISFNQSGINNEDLKLFSEAAKENDTLESLDFSSNDTFSDLTPICDLIQNNKNITTLYFNNVYNCDFISLIERLKTNKTIKKIKICETSDKIFNEFWEMLKINNTINHVSFKSYYSINMLKIKEVLDINRTITELSLHNNITSEWTPLIEALKINTTLTYLNLNDCIINDYKPFYEILKNNKILKVVKLRHYSTSKYDNNCDILIDALKHNNVIERLNVDGIKIDDALTYLKTIYFHPTLKECIAKIKYEDRQIVCNALNSTNKLPDIGYQDCINYKGYFVSKDKNKHISQFVY